MKFSLFSKQLKAVLKLLSQLFIFSNIIDADDVFFIDSLKVLWYLLFLNQNELSFPKGNKVTFVESEFTK